MYGQNFNPYNPAFNQFSAQMAQQQLAQQRLMQMQPPAQQQNGLQFVNGRESVDAYMMGPNEKVILMDSNRPRFYLKETDAAGVAKVTAYDFTAVNDAPETSQYVTRNEFEELRSAYESLAESIQQPSSATASEPSGDKRGNAEHDA